MVARRYNATNFSVLVLDGVFSFKPQPLYTRENSWYIVSRRLMVPRAGLYLFGEDINLLPPLGIKL
jgi:hypothetical protein